FYQPDPITGMQMAALALLALIRRDGTGQGERIDGAMLEAAAGYIGESLMEAALGGSPRAIGNRSPDFAPSGVFRCAGDDRWIAISVVDDTAWARLSALPGFPADLKDQGYAAGAARLAAQDAIEAALGAWTSGLDAESLMAACQGKGVAAGVVRKMSEGFADPHLQARNWFRTIAHPDLGEHKYNGFLWRCRGLEVRRPPPRLGEHSEELLRDLLGLDHGEVAYLRATGVTGAVL
ncbi:MAG TPA: CoA transferase, partial [Caulobacteraceae bacterium]